MIIKACPRCGRPVLNTCWHPPDDDVRSVDMPVERALRLARVELDEAEHDYQRAKALVEELEELSGGRL